MVEIENLINDYLQQAPTTSQEILFSNIDQHPVWEDNREIMQLATQQILQPVGVLSNEHVLAYIGVHAKTAITGKRDSIGFLITNFRILTQYDFSVLLTPQPAKATYFTSKTTAEEVSSKVWNEFLTLNKLSIPNEQLAAMHDVLVDLTKIILPALQQSGHLPEDIKKSTSVTTRIPELGLQKELKTYAENEKKLKAFAEKFKIENIKYGMVDKPLFGGVYGLAITEKGITSRDLMEDSQTSTWDEIKTDVARNGNKNFEILAGNKIHIVPSHNNDLVPALITLINEIATKEISF